MCHTLPGSMLLKSCCFTRHHPSYKLHSSKKQQRRCTPSTSVQAASALQVITMYNPPPPFPLFSFPLLHILTSYLCTFLGLFRLAKLLLNTLQPLFQLQFLLPLSFLFGLAGGLLGCKKSYNHQLLTPTNLVSTLTAYSPNTAVSIYRVRSASTDCVKYRTINLMHLMMKIV